MTIQWNLNKICIGKIDEESQDEPNVEFTNSPDRKDREEEKRIHVSPTLRKIYSDNSPNDQIKRNDNNMLDSIDEDNSGLAQSNENFQSKMESEESISKSKRKTSDIKQMEEDTDEEIIDTRS